MHEGASRLNRAAAAPDDPPAQGRVPDFFIAGHPKCGTTALYLALRSHPQVYMSAVKEPQYFSGEIRAEAARRPASRLPQTLEDYLALFAPAGRDQLAGEASPSYLRSSTAAAEIAALNPAARIIAIFREPAGFLRSLHLQYVQTMIEPERDLERALELEDARREGRNLPGGTHWRQTLLYSEHVRYVEQLRRYQAVFPPEQMLVLIYDDFRADNEATVRRVQRFLGIDDTLPVHTIEANPSIAVRSGALHNVVRSLQLAEDGPLGAAKRLANTVLPRNRRRALFAPVRRRVNRRVRFARPDPLDEALTAQLRERFRGEVLALAEYLDRDLLSLWGYEQPN